VIHRALISYEPGSSNLGAIQTTTIHQNQLRGLEATASVQRQRHRPRDNGIGPAATSSTQRQRHRSRGNGIGPETTASTCPAASISAQQGFSTAQQHLNQSRSINIAQQAISIGLAPSKSVQHHQNLPRTTTRTKDISSDARIQINSLQSKALISTIPTSANRRIP